MRLAAWSGTRSGERSQEAEVLAGSKSKALDYTMASILNKLFISAQRCLVTQKSILTVKARKKWTFKIGVAVLEG